MYAGKISPHQPSGRQASCEVAQRVGLGVFLSAAALTLAGTASQSARAETRSYAVGMFHVATYSDGGHRPGDNCPRGGNGKSIDARRLLKRLYGLSDAKIDKLTSESGYAAQFEGKPLYVLMRDRGRINGKAVCVYSYPTAAPKNTAEFLVEGRHAYGFNLDGKGADDAHSFIDPQTGEKGVDDQLFRALGCYEHYDVNLPVRPGYQESVWLTGLASIPAWLFSITGDDLGRDGPVTVEFHKALEHPRTGADGALLQGATYTIDPSPRSHGTLKGVIKDGVLTAAGDSVLMENEPPQIPEFDMANVRMRLKLNPNGTAAGYIGAYQRWLDYWYFTVEYNEGEQGVDSSTLYYNLRDLAETDPDPVTGQKRRISATWRIDATSVLTTGARPFEPPAHAKVKAAERDTGLVAANK